MAPFWKNEELEDAKKQSHMLLDTSTIFDKIPETFPSESLITDAYSKSSVNVTESLWVDSSLQEWTGKNCILKGSKHCLWKFIQQPIHDKESLLRRQNALSSKELLSEYDNNLQIISECEADLLWILNIPKFSEAWPLNMAFPTIPILKYINYFPLPLTMFHFYKIFMAPIMNVVTPFSTLIGPWLYIRKNLKLNISFSAYANVLLMALKQGVKSSGNIRTDGIKYFSLFLYIFFYIYAIIQCFEHAHILYKILKNLEEKLTKIRMFINITQDMIKTLGPEMNELRDFLPKDFDYSTFYRNMKLPSRMSGMYVLFTDSEWKNKIKSMLQWVYTLDMVLVAKKLVKSRKCCIAEYNESDGITQFWNMGHIMLSNNQVRNPLSLKKNLIITGPNAAGKTTYVRAVCTNTILAHTFGIACAVRAEVSIIHAIGSFMRIEDSLGHSSLFEAEAKRCAELLEQAEAIVHSGKTALYFLDEPMHSTPPIEGCATSMAVIEYMGRLPGIRMMVTTHYHDCVKLEEIHPNHFQNISMDAYVSNETGLYMFPYNIKNGASFKCIALELLNEKKLPPGLVRRAIDLKNKICSQQVTKSS
jgi:hypothetical protein